jgi:hypothetical protein
MFDSFSAFYPVLTFWLGFILGVFMWKWRNSKVPSRWNPWCWLSKQHIWAARIPTRVWEVNLFDCTRCGKLSRKGPNGHYLL